MMQDGSERRGARRIEANLSLRINAPSADASRLAATLETINISTSGIYFRSESFIEPMTKLALELELTVIGDESERTETELVSCEGLVVRTIPEEESAEADDYEIAVFFTHMESNAVSVLERHIAALLQQGT
jgi:hypothetical protein